MKIQKALKKIENKSAEDFLKFYNRIKYYKNYVQKL